jgi:hypothetical protein
MSTSPALGPVALCTLVTRNGQTAVDAYCRYMHQQLIEQGPLDSDTAQALGMESLEGCNCWTLGNLAGRQWLHIVEHHDATERNSLDTYGWLAMEVLVENVDELADRLKESAFELLRRPADLDVSDNIRACQVRGPAGEILYLTQVRGEAPPFELPSCEAPVDHLFIPVLSTPSRDESLAGYSAISGNQGLSFDTKITVINQERGFEMDRRHPVATLQLANNALIEIDEISDTVPAPDGIATGVANIAFYCSQSPGAQSIALASGALAGYSASPHIGSAGEHYTLVYA